MSEPSSELQAAEVIRAYASFVWRTLRYQGVPERQLDDLSQEVFLTVVRCLGRFEGRSTLQSWIYGICRNVVLHARRSHARKPELITDMVPDSGIAETQSSDLSRRHTLRLLQRALADLPEKQRMVFVLFEIEEMPMDEVAAATGCALSTAYSRLYAARDQLKLAFTELSPSGSFRDFVEVL